MRLAASSWTSSRLRSTGPGPCSKDCYEILLSAGSRKASVRRSYPKVVPRETCVLRSLTLRKAKPAKQSLAKSDQSCKMMQRGRRLKVGLKQ